MIELWRPVKRFRKWESLFIINPEKVEEKDQVLEKIKQLVESKEGEILKIDEWGMRKLAYPIEKKKQGYYILIEFYGLSKLPKDLEEFFRIDERVIRFIIVKLEDRFTPNEENLEAKEV
ncbi:MAG: 30S ribosomal protein S6 [Thermodesulfobacterium sp.]|nr:30S ribosomal protein S6 [Thermodesulfobacterium sp.]